jgi:hypothetical protein
VVWLNQDEEAGLPYDITIAQPNGRVTYVEVKTRPVHAPAFHISLAELLEAVRLGVDYEAVLVLRGRPVRVMRIPNLAEFVSKHRPLMLVLKDTEEKGDSSRVKGGIKKGGKSRLGR